MSSVFQNSPEWELGELATRAVRRWLLARGFYLLPVDHLDMGGAPGFIGPGGRFLTVPDILAIGGGGAEWHEVKWKSAPVLYQITRRFRTGVDAASWEHYRRVEAASGLAGHLSLVQLRPGGEAEPEPLLQTASFARLAGCLTSHAGGGDVKVWWDCDDFDQFPILDLGDEWRGIDIGPRLIRPWEQKSKQGEAPRWRPSSAKPPDEQLGLF